FGETELARNIRVQTKKGRLRGDSLGEAGASAFSGASSSPYSRPTAAKKSSSRFFGLCCFDRGNFINDMPLGMLPLRCEFSFAPSERAWQSDFSRCLLSGDD